MFQLQHSTLLSALIRTFPILHGCMHCRRYGSPLPSLSALNSDPAALPFHLSNSEAPTTCSHTAPLSQVWDTAALAQALSRGEQSSKPARLQALAAVAGHDKEINAVAVSPNDALLVSASQDRTAKVGGRSCGLEVHCMLADQRNGDQ